MAAGDVARPCVVLSVQLLQEFYVRGHACAARAPLSHEDAAGLIRAFSRFRVVDNTEALFKAGLSVRASSPLSLRDALILASGCEAWITEDLNSGQDIVAEVQDGDDVNPGAVKCAYQGSTQCPSL